MQKIVYQAFVALMAFIALVFVAPSIKYSSLVKQIDFEFKRHMKFRYDKDFSYVFLDRIQREYYCCDEDWYRANYNDKIPLSCYTDDLEFSQLHQQTCPEAIGSIVSTRCSIIAACLLAILIGLAILVALDVLKLMAAKENYDVRAREQVLVASASNGGAAARSPPRGGGGDDDDDISSPISSQNISRRDESEDEDDDDDGGFIRRAQLQDQNPNRLGSGERRRERPLLTGGRSTPLAEQEPDLEPDLDLDYFKRRYGSPPAGMYSPPAILTRANYVSQPAGSRPKSPVFVTSSRSCSPASRAAGAGDSASSSPPTQPRGVLKKTSSLSRSIDRDSLIGRGESTNEADQLEVSYQQAPQRPPFNVRFAEP